jgi:hypothetical protein
VSRSRTSVETRIVVIPIVASSRSKLLIACGEGIEGSSISPAKPLRRPKGSGLSGNGPTPASYPVRGSALKDYE